MGSSGTLLCTTAFVLIFLSSAFKDELGYEQRDVTFDIDKIMQEGQQPDSLMMQKKVDLADLFDPKELIEQVMVSPPEQFDAMSERGGSRPGVLIPRAGRPGFSNPPLMDYPVQFPLGQPTEDNLQAICLHGDRRPTYPDSYFPSSGFGQQKRRASAVNNAESWFRTCCEGNQTWEREVTLCCATQVWELSVNSFCKEDSSVKDRLYHCCRLTGSDRLKCFHSDAPNPNYEATEELPLPPLSSSSSFSFDPSTCQRTVMTPYSVRGNRRRKEKKNPSVSKKIDMIFPLGQPTEDNIESLCRNQKLRPLYRVKCLPGDGYEWLAQQAKAVNRIEKRFKLCCKKKQDVLKCANQKWHEELNRYCAGENGEAVDFHCCLGDPAGDRSNCFQKASLDPHYNMTSATEELSLHNICDTHKIIKKKFPVGVPLKKFVNQCCPLSEMERNLCLQTRLEEISKMCSSKKTSPPAVRRCCRMSSQEPGKCISKIVMDAITKAANVLRQKKKKKCPLS